MHEVGKEANAISEKRIFSKATGLELVYFITLAQISIFISSKSQDLGKSKITYFLYRI